MHCLFFVLTAGVQFVTVFGNPAFATKPNNMLESLKNNLTECMQEVKANMTDVEYFFRKYPQRTYEGKCFVACILNKYGVVKNATIDEERVMQMNQEMYNYNKTVAEDLIVALKVCSWVDEEFELCEYVSKWNDCVHLKMRHVSDLRRRGPSHTKKSVSEIEERLFNRIGQI